jgi:hypothetical protein
MRAWGLILRKSSKEEFYKQNQQVGFRFAEIAS